jgi:hypothetical protein
LAKSELAPPKSSPAKSPCQWGCTVSPVLRHCFRRKLENNRHSGSSATGLQLRWRGYCSGWDSGRPRVGQGTIAFDGVDGSGAALIGHVEEFSGRIEVDAEGLRASGDGGRRIGGGLNSA